MIMTSKIKNYRNSSAALKKEKARYSKGLKKMQTKMLKPFKTAQT